MGPRLRRPPSKLPSSTPPYHLFPSFYLRSGYIPFTNRFLQTTKVCSFTLALLSSRIVVVIFAVVSFPSAPSESMVIARSTALLLLFPRAREKEKTHKQRETKSREPRRQSRKRARSERWRERSQILTLWALISGVHCHASRVPNPRRKTKEKREKKKTLGKRNPGRRKRREWGKETIPPREIKTEINFPRFLFCSFSCAF